MSSVFLTSQTVGTACPKVGEEEGQPVQGVGGSLWLGHLEKGRLVENKVGKMGPSDEKPRELCKIFQVSHQVMRCYERTLHR